MAAQIPAYTALITNSVYRCQAFYATLLRLCPTSAAHGYCVGRIIPASLAGAVYSNEPCAAPPSGWLGQWRYVVPIGAREKPLRMLLDAYCFYLRCAYGPSCGQSPGVAGNGRHARDLAPDVFVCCGDMAAEEKQFGMTMMALEGVSCPKLFVPGNHDVWVQKAAWVERGISSQQNTISSCRPCAGLPGCIPYGLNPMCWMM